MLMGSTVESADKVSRLDTFCVRIGLREEYSLKGF